MTVRETGRESRRPHRYTPQADNTATMTRCPPDEPWLLLGPTMAASLAPCRPSHQPVAHVSSSRRVDRPTECVAQCTGRNVSDFCFAWPPSVFWPADVDLWPRLFALSIGHSLGERPTNLRRNGTGLLCCAARKICFRGLAAGCASLLTSASSAPTIGRHVCGQGRLEVSGERADVCAPATRRYGREVAARA